MKKLVLCLCVLTSLTVSAQQVAKSLTASNGVKIGFYQYTPTNYNSGTKYPLIIFLHGIGERGNGTTDLPNILGLGVPGAINQGHTMTFTYNGKTETFLVLSPQLSTAYGNWQNFYVDEMLKYAKSNLSIDTNRIMLTGLSLGGGGVWAWSGASITNAKTLAAIGVCCGTCSNINFCNYASANLPVWAFHASDDGTVGVGCTTGSISAINNCKPAVAPYMTIWPDGNHYIWGRVFSTDYSYQNPNLYEWFMCQDKSKAVNKRPVANAGSDLTTTTASASVTLDGTKSTDADGKIVRYIWTKLSGPSYGTITTSVSTDGKTTVTGLNAAGTYSYQLKVADDRADWTLDTVNVVVSTSSNKAPTANAGSDVSITLPTNTVTLSGSGTDADGTISKYAWTQSSGTTATIASASSASTSITGLTTAGTYVFKLTVTDNSGSTASDEVTVTVNETASKPTTNTANAGADETITLPTNSVTLTAAASVDPYGGKLLAYQWVKTSGPAATITSTTAATTTATGLTEGTYVFTLTVWDSKWFPTSDTKTVVVKAAASTGGSTGGTTTTGANAGADQWIKLPTTSVNLTAAASVDPYGGKLLAYKWVKTSGPDATITSATAATTTATGLSVGTYTFTLTVWDSKWSPTNDAVIVTVRAASSTTADAGADATITLPTNSVSLDGSGTVDPYAGTIQSYQWVKTSGPAATISSSTSATTTATGLAAGDYVFTLTVKDSKGVSTSDTKSVTVRAAGSPTAYAGPDATITLPTSTVSLDASGTVDPYGSTILVYKWVKTSGPAATITNGAASTTTATGLTAGTYVFTLTVWDSKWNPTSDTKTVVVNPATSSSSSTITIDKKANAGSDITITLPVNATTLDGSASADPAGVIKSWKWAQISGPNTATIANAASATTAISGLVEGGYTFKLTIWDNGWNPENDTVQVIVKGSGDGSPAAGSIANAGADQTIILPSNSVTLSAAASVEPYGSSFKAWSWTKISGPEQHNISNASNATTTVSNLVEGTYTFQLMIWDSKWYPRADTVRVYVMSSSTNTLRTTSSATVTTAATSDAKVAVATATPAYSEQVLLYPNPARTTLNVQTTAATIGASVVNVYDMNGKLVQRTSFQKTSVQHLQSLPVSSFVPGVYTVEVVVDGKTRLISKFVKQ